VIAGLAVKINPGFSPVQRPEMPDSAIICWPVSNRLGALDFFVSDPAEDGVQSCWRVAITATGMVKT